MKIYYSLGKKKRHTIKNHLVVNNQADLIIHKSNHKKGKRHDYIFKNITRIILLLQKEVVNVFDLGYLGVEKDFPEQYHLYHVKRKGIMNYPKKKKITTKTILKEE